MPPSRSTRANSTYQTESASAVFEALDQIPVPVLTIQQKSSFLEHIAKVFFFILKECMNYRQSPTQSRDSLSLPEGFQQSLFDLQALTLIFMENNIEHYTLGARIMILTATANTEEENNLLKNALQLLHSTCPPFDRPTSPVLIEWLWQHHFDSLQYQFVELPEVQAFYGIP